MTCQQQQPPQFVQCVRSVFQGWTALQLAVDHGFGGPMSREKGEWFINAVDQYFRDNKKLDRHEVADLLEDIMKEEFNTDLEDESQTEIASTLCKQYHLFTTGQFDQLTAFISTAPIAALTKSEAAPNQSEFNTSDETMDDVIDDMDRLGDDVDDQEMDCEEDEESNSKRTVRFNTRSSQASTEPQTDEWTTVTKKMPRKVSSKGL